MHAKNVNINPCNMCMPMGGVMAFKGIAGSVVIIHGSQGCSTYIRRHIAEHFNEPVDVGSSSLNEKGTIYGGEKNLKTGLKNLIKVYKPKVVGVLTTCLAETIGEDIKRITSSFLEENSGLKTILIPVSTPGYGGSHTEGYFYALRKITEELAKPVNEKTDKIGVIIPNISPADIREIKRIISSFKLKFVMLPDFSESLDGGYSKDYKKVSAKGTRIKDIESMPGLKGIIEFSTTISSELSPGVYLNQVYGTPLYRIPLPIGLKNTDNLISILEKISGKKPPAVLLNERERLLDTMIDSHKHNAQGKAVIFNEPEYLLSMGSLLLENGVDIQLAATGSKSSKLEYFSINGKKQIPVYAGADFDLIFSKTEGEDVNLAIGNSDGRCLTERKGIPLIRHGFPIHDRMGGGRILSAGYAGSISMLDRITNTILEGKLSGYRSRMKESLKLQPKKAERTGEEYER